MKLDPVFFLTADEHMRIDALVARHLAALNAARRVTDNEMTLNRIDALIRKVRRYSVTRVRALGMLGPNGYGPEIALVCGASA